MLHLHTNQFAFRLIQKFKRLYDLARDCRRRHNVRRSKIQFAWTTAAGEVAVLRADGHRFGIRRSARTSVDACAARGIDQLCASPFKDFYVALTTGILL